MTKWDLLRRTIIFCLLYTAPASKLDRSACRPLIAMSRGSKGLSKPRLLLIFGIQIWFLDVHQEAGSVHFN